MRAVVVALVVIGLMSGVGVLSAHAGLLASQHGRVSRADRPANSLTQHVNVIAPDGKDPRYYVRRVGPFAAIGSIVIKIEPGERGFEKGWERFRHSTSILISPCIIKTAAHTVFGTNLVHKSKAKTIMVSFGEGKNNDYKHVDVKATIIFLGHRTSGGDPSLDVTYAKLDKCVGEDPEIGWMEEAPEEAKPGMPVILAGYASDRDANRISAQACQIVEKSKSDGSTGYEDGGWYHDCATRNGSSSAPLFRIVDGIPREVAFHVRSFQDQPGFLQAFDRDHASVAGEPSIGYSNVEARIEADIKRFGRPNPQLALNATTPQWIKDGRTDCLVWNSLPTPAETVTWSGVCGENRLAEGRGTLTWQLGGKFNGRYDGEYRAGHKEGTGTFDSASGTHSSGQYRRDQLNGQGSVTQSNGDRHEGEYVDGKPNGMGRAVIGGIAYQGVWKDGCFRQANGTFVSFMVSPDTCK